MTLLRRVTQMAYGDALASEIRVKGKVAVMSSGGETGTHNMANTLGPCVVIGRKGSHGSIHWSNLPAFTIDTAYYIDARHTSSNLRWLYYALMSANLQNLSQDVGVPGLSREAAYSADIGSVPELLEQQRITDFLDEQVALIDRAITLRRQQRVLAAELLSHKRDSVFTDLAADTVRLSYLANFFSDGDWIESPYITEEGLRLIQTGNIGVGLYKDQGFRYISEETFSSLKCTEIFPGDLLVSRLSPPVGRACLAPDLNERMVASVDVAIIRSHSMNHQFMAHYMSSRFYLDAADIASRGATMARISRTQLGTFRIPVTAAPQQNRVCDELDAYVSDAGTRRQALGRHIALLQERKQALITAAVTGQLDVTTARSGLGVDVP